MIPLETLLVFITASFALALVPGPDNIFVLTQSVLYGRRAGLFVNAGLCTGLLFHTALVTLGVAALLQASPLAFNLIKTVGALYLLYLAWQAWHAHPSLSVGKQSRTLPKRALYFRGLMMNMSNPKVAIFFIAFLPQFSDPESGSVFLQMAMLGVLFMLATLIIFSAIAWAGELLARGFIHSVKAQRVLNRFAAAIFATLAIRLLFIEL
ncbi:LysE family translocator [Gayadomonas joobiniege]|uniref:LysE family translocator n=1 Tax=Gayadomonas joobiniege TaxID=1234606 RepID=UPI00037BD38D|nr:LysE family translocator [Gayadomonas joobiniege]